MIIIDRGGSNPLQCTRSEQIRKKPPEWAAISEFVPICCNFTLSREPSSSGTVSELRRLSAERRTRPTSRPLCLFLRFPPAEFLFLAEKGLAGGGVVALGDIGGVGLYLRYI